MAGHCAMTAADRPACAEDRPEASRYVAEYLVAEVLARQPEAIQAFLKATSVLDHLTASLCDAVTGADRQ